MIPLADALDAVGLITRSVAHSALLFDALADASLERAGELEPEQPARIGFWEEAAGRATPEVSAVVGAALARAIETGVKVEIAPSPAQYDSLLAIHHITMLVGRARRLTRSSSSDIRTHMGRAFAGSSRRE